jgi:class 3 adenylate cyclase
MPVCANCGAENREGARFCDACGAPLVEAAPVREVRKVVTVLFCDVSGSTALGERIDPESLRRVMSRYFEVAKATVERHGGSVEKFIGDAVMAVFGVPVVHEDDALRAVRAADELRGGLDRLNDELQRSYGTRLELRIGVNTGEVVTGTEERLATGDAVNVAARLEQAARPSEVLLGEETYRLVRAAVVAESAPPLEAKGKAEPLIAYRLSEVHPETPVRPQGAPMIGRRRQRQLLEGAFANVVSERACHLFTILGAAGVGKSRLAHEVLAGLDGATVVRGRCLPYGEGISYWPVTEVVKQLVPEGGAMGPLASILGDDSAAGSPEEIAWAFRKLLESRAAEQPLIVVFDDVHWGEPTFLDLVEHVADLSRGAPILLLCMARPELLDARPTWGGGKLNATNVLLEPLAPDETADLLTALAGDVPDALRRRILEAAGGNPLFVEEMVAVASAGDGDVAVPPTIQALLAARLDQLEPPERSVLERGAVEGHVFHRGAVAALAPDEPQPDGSLIALVRKDLVRPEPAVLPNDDAYRFRHLLIRDTAYEALPKATRAGLHERFARWLDEHGADLVELDEIVGYHLEQAYRYRAELGPLDAAAEVLAREAASRLVRSGDRAHERGDLPAAQALFGRAAELFAPDSADRRRAVAERAYLLAQLGEFEAALELADDAEAGATAAGDEALLARLALLRLEVRNQSDPSFPLQEALAEAEGAQETLERLGDEPGAVWGLRLVGNLYGWLGQSRRASEVWQRALERAERISPRSGDEILMWLLWESWWGPGTTEAGLRRSAESIERARRSGSKRLEAVGLAIRGVFEAYQCRFDEARADMSAGRTLLRELGDTIYWSGVATLEAELELVAGDPQAAYDALSEAHPVLAERAETGYLATLVGFRAQAALALGRDEEALELADETARLSAPDDFDPLTRLRLVQAQVLARRGDLARAEELLREAGEILAPSDYSIVRTDLALSQADVARLAGEPEAEREALARVVAAADEKGILPVAERARERLAALNA